MLRTASSTSFDFRKKNFRSLRDATTTSFPCNDISQGFKFIQQSFYSWVPIDISHCFSSDISVFFRTLLNNTFEQFSHAPATYGIVRLRSFGVIWIRTSDPRSVWIMVHQRNRRIHNQSGFTGSFDASWSRPYHLDGLLIRITPKERTLLTFKRYARRREIKLDLLTDVKAVWHLPLFLLSSHEILFFQSDRVEFLRE